jgi:hypothetical protein
MRVLDVPQKGARGNTVTSRNRFGRFQRERVSPNQPATDAQRAAWANMTELSRLWNELGQARWVAWRRLAATVHSRSALSQSGPLDGCQPVLKQWRKSDKKRYHIPLEGSRIFIRVWQQTNGWENEVGMFRDSALVPTDWGRWRVTPRTGTKKVPRQ